MNQQWWIISDGKGGLRQVVTDGAHPKDAGEDMTGRTAAKMDRRGDFDLETPNLTSGKWSDNLEALKTRLLEMIDEQRETAQMQFLTSGGVKKMIYTQKAKEVTDYRALGSTALAALNLEARRSRFPAAMAEVDLTGATLAAVIDKMEAGASSSNIKVYKIEALAQKAKAGVTTATAGAAARAAAAVNWTV